MVVYASSERATRTSRDVEREVHMSTTTHEVIDEFVDRLKGALPSLDAEIAALEEQLAEKRSTRKATAAAIRLREPEFEADKRPGPKSTPSTNGKVVSDAKLREIRAWLEARRDEIAASRGITGSEVARRDDFDVPASAATVTAAMRELHDRGVLRLDHMGTGGGKWYVVA